jgi:hypothetical protein
MAPDNEEPHAAPHAPAHESHSLPPPPPSPSPSDTGEFAATTSTSQTPSQRPMEDVSSSASVSSPAPTLANNPDYIALQSSLSLLNAQHRQAIDDMHSLVALKEKALANPAWFKHLLVTGQLGKLVPQKQNVVRCPRVDWEKYGSLGIRLGREVDKPTPLEPIYTVSVPLIIVLELTFRIFTFYRLWIIRTRATCKSKSFGIGRRG